MSKIFEIPGCVDCIMWLANGEVPEDNGNDWSADNIEARWKGYFVCVAGDENTENHFSHLPCEVCGSPLGGDRYPCNAWEVKEPYRAYVDNIGCIGEFSNKRKAIDAARQTVKRSARADEHAFVMRGDSLIWERGGLRNGN